MWLDAVEWAMIVRDEFVDHWSGTGIGRETLDIAAQLVIIEEITAQETTDGFGGRI